MCGQDDKFLFHRRLSKAKNGNGNFDKFYRKTPLNPSLEERRALNCIEKLLIIWYNLTIRFHEGHCGTIKSPWGVMTPRGFLHSWWDYALLGVTIWLAYHPNSCIIRELRILPIMLMIRLTNISSKDICGTSLPCRISLMRAVAHLVYHTNFIRGKRILACSYLAKMVYCNHSLFVLIVYLI